MSALALGGAPLLGNKLVRFIYADEAGISDHEPVTVVAAVIVHGDTQWRPVKLAMDLLRDEVPTEFRDGFIFHCKTLYGDPKRRFRETWPLEDRIRLIEKLLRLVSKHGLFVSLGYVRRRTGVSADWRHIMAFSTAVASASKTIMDESPDEIATLVVEHTTSINRILTGMVDALRAPETMPGGAPGFMKHLNIASCRAIVDTPHFVAKDKAPMLQLADACAFSLKRLLGGMKDGDRLARAFSVHALTWAEGVKNANGGLVGFGPGALGQPS